MQEEEENEETDDDEEDEVPFLIYYLSCRKTPCRHQRKPALAVVVDPTAITVIIIVAKEPNREGWWFLGDNKKGHTRENQH